MWCDWTYSCANIYLSFDFKDTFFQWKLSRKTMWECIKKRHHIFSIVAAEQGWRLLKCEVIGLSLVLILISHFVFVTHTFNQIFKEFPRDVVLEDVLRILKGGPRAREYFKHKSFWVMLLTSRVTFWVDKLDPSNPFCRRTLECWFVYIAPATCVHLLGYFL